MDTVKVIFSVYDTDIKPSDFINSFGVKIISWQGHPIADCIIFEVSEEDYKKLPSDIFIRQNKITKDKYIEQN